MKTPLHVYRSLSDPDECKEKGVIYVVSLKNTYHLLYLGPPILFIFIYWKDRITNQNEIHCYRAYTIIDNASIITIKKKQFKLSALLGMGPIYSLLIFKKSIVDFL